jgi:hypothetical protein
MTPIEKLRTLTEKSKISISLLMLGSLLIGAAGAAGAAFHVRDEAVTQLRAEIRQTSLDIRRDREDSLRGFMSRAEFWERVAPKLQRLNDKLDTLIEREERRR